MRTRRSKNQSFYEDTPRESATASKLGVEVLSPTDAGGHFYKKPRIMMIACGGKGLLC